MRDDLAAPGQQTLHHQLLSRHWARRALVRALGMIALALVLLPGLGVRPAQAHVPIVLLVLAPKDGQTVTADPAVVIYAQRTLLGADQTTYTMTLDQRPIDPANGPSQPGQIRAGQQARLSLHALSPGVHRLTLTYQPDSDEPAQSTSVAFTVRRPGAGLSVVPVGVGLGVAAAVVAAAWWARRRHLLGAAR
jgi:hypothetical protein